MDEHIKYHLETLALPNGTLRHLQISQANFTLAFPVKIFNLLGIKKSSLPMNCDLSREARLPSRIVLRNKTAEGIPYFERITLLVDILNLQICL